MIDTFAVFFFLNNKKNEVMGLFLSASAIEELAAGLFHGCSLQLCGVGDPLPAVAKPFPFLPLVCVLFLGALCSTLPNGGTVKPCCNTLAAPGAGLEEPSGSQHSYSWLLGVCD